MLVDNMYCHIEMRDVLWWVSFLHLSCTGGRKHFAALTLDNVLVPAFSAEGPGHRTSEYSRKGPREFYWGIVRDPNRQESGSHLSTLSRCSNKDVSWMNYRNYQLFLFHLEQRLHSDGDLLSFVSRMSTLEQEFCFHFWHQACIRCRTNASVHSVYYQLLISTQCINEESNCNQLWFMQIKYSPQTLGHLPGQPAGGESTDNRITV